MFKPVISVSCRDILLLLLHNKLPIPERLCRTGFRVDPFCSFCPGNTSADLVHFFCHCLRSSNCWLWMRSKIENMCPILKSKSDWQLLNLDFPTISQDDQISWLISEFVSFAWTELQKNQNVNMKIEKFFGYLTFKYRVGQPSIGKVPFLD